MPRAAQFSLRTALTCVTIVACWLGAIQYARFTGIPVAFAVALSGLVTASWYDEYLSNWRRLAIVSVLIAVTVYLLLPEVY